MFLSASFYAMLYGDSDVIRYVANDLHDVLVFGFAVWKNGEYDGKGIDYTKYSTDLFNY